MSKESYIKGFCKVAEAHGIDPAQLARCIAETDTPMGKAAQASAYVNFLRDFVSKDEIDDELAKEYGRALNKNRDLFETEYELYEPQHHHFNWLWRPETGPVQKMIHAFKKVEDKLPDSKKEGFRRVADKLVANLNKKMSPFPILPSYTYTPDEGGASQFGFMVF